MAPRTPAHELLDALTGRDFPALEQVLAPTARLRALLPTETLEVAGREAIVTKLRAWFGESERFRVMASAVEPIADRHSVRYRFRLDRGGAEYLIEQHLFCTLDEGAITAIDLVCSGFMPVPGSSTRDFNAGNLGCGDGLAAQFKHRIGEIDVGDLLRVNTTDPSAKEELPSLARLMGHIVHSVEAQPDGSLMVMVERGR